MRPPRYKEVLPNEIKPGDEYTGYKYRPLGDTTPNTFWESYCSVIIDENGTPLVWGRDKIEDNIEIIHFYRYLTWQEQKEWYNSSLDMSNSKNILNLTGLHTDLYVVGDGCHEMWNGWIETDWKEQLISLVDEDFFIVGVAPAPYVTSIFRDPVAVVCEMFDTGERFWCHSEKDWINDMREESLDFYNELIKKKEEVIDKFVEVGEVYPISPKELKEALKKASDEV